MAKISVALATFNEEQNLPRCLASLKSFASEIIIADGSSTDQTPQIAKKFGAKVIKTTNKPMFHINKNLALDACSGDWILVLDADEEVSPALARELQTVVNQKPAPGSPIGYWLKRKNFFLTRFLKKGGQYPDPVIRFFRKGQGRHPEVSVHEQIKVNGPTGQLENDLLHYASPTFTRYLTRENRYSTLEAENLKNKNLPLNFGYSLEYLFIKPLGTFLALYFRHKGFEDGFPGFVFALFSGIHHALSFIKYWELKNAATKISPEKDWV